MISKLCLAVHFRCKYKISSFFIIAYPPQCIHLPGICDVNQPVSYGLVSNKRRSPDLYLKLRMLPLTQAKSRVIGLEGFTKLLDLSFSLSRSGLKFLEKVLNMTALNLSYFKN